MVRRTGIDVAWTDKDLWWDELVDAQSDQHTAEAFPAEQPLFILYTSGTTGKPKGIVHTSGGYLTQAAYTHHAVFDHKPGTDVYWCTADIGWVTGHSYIVYGPLANRATADHLRGHPEHPARGPALGNHRQVQGQHLLHGTHPDPDVHEVGRGHPRRSTSWIPCGSSVSVGEPINPEAWMWYRENIGHDSCPIVDTWWQTETGGIMISPLPGVTATKPGSAMAPVPGISAIVVNDEGHPRRQRRGRVPGHRQTLARHAAHHLRRRRTVQGHLLVPVRLPGLLLRR